jgi:hypothetical protein
MSLLLLLHSDITGSITATEASDVVAVAGQSAHVGTFAATETSDFSAATRYWFQYWADDYWSANYWHSIPSQFVGEVAAAGAIEGELAATEGADAFAAAVDVWVAGTFALTDAADTAAVAGDVYVSGSIALTESADTAEITGNLVVSAQLSATEADDAADIVGELAGGPVVGSLDAIEAADTASVSGAVDVVGALDATEGNDSLSFVSALPPVSVGGGVAQRLARLPDFGPRPLPRRQLLPIDAQLDVSERRDTAAIVGHVDWSGDDEEILLMSNAA